MRSKIAIMSGAIVLNIAWSSVNFVSVPHRMSHELLAELPAISQMFVCWARVIMYGNYAWLCCKCTICT